MLLLLFLLMQSGERSSNGVVIAHQGGPSSSAVRQIQLINADGTIKDFVVYLTDVKRNSSCSLSLGATVQLNWKWNSDPKEMKVTQWRCLAPGDHIDPRLIAYSKDLRRALAAVDGFRSYLVGDKRKPIDRYWCSSQSVPDPAQDWVVELISKFGAAADTSMKASIRQNTITLTGSEDHYSHRSIIEIRREAMCISSIRPLPQ